MIMTHHFKRDQELLSLLQNHPCRYLGILGSRYRTVRLLGGLDKPKWIFSPAGLSIGSGTNGNCYKHSGRNDTNNEDEER